MPVFVLLAAFLTAAVLAAPIAHASAENGGGYAATGQIEGVGYAAVLYNAENGLPTSDANTLLPTADGYIWIGGYGGIIRYDGATFERQDASGGLTSGKTLFEDSRGRLWVGTNDNGAVMLSDGESTHYTYKEGLPSSSIRGFAEGADGTVYIGSTNGVCYVDENMELHALHAAELDNEYIIRMVSGPDGAVYGNTRNGDAFRIENRRVVASCRGDEFGAGRITTVYADPNAPGMVYFGTDSDRLCYGRFADGFSLLREIAVAPASNVNWIEYACGRVWIIAGGVAGYLDENEKFCVLENIPLNSGIESVAEDYQGNLWFTSSRQGVMKLVTNNFQNLTEIARLDGEVVNTTCLHDGLLYIGTDKGLQLMDGRHMPVENELTHRLADTRIRCIREDRGGNLWIATYTNGFGLVCYTRGGEIKLYNEENGLLSNGVRCVTNAKDGSVLVGSNGGLNVVRDGTVIRSFGEAQGIGNTVFLTVEEGADGKIYAGSDGDGIYVVDGDALEHLGRDDGLTSDVILRIKRDDAHGVLWIVTSNSIEYMKDGAITQVENFPYNNNYDVFFDDNDNLWVLSSYGVYCVKARDMLGGGSFDYRFYNNANGLPSVPTGNSFSELDNAGNLYIAGRDGVSRVNINNYFDQTGEIKVGVKSILCDGEAIRPNAEGAYVIPADAGRIHISAAVLDYTMSNPTVRVYLEGYRDEGVTSPRSDLSALEFTALPYGDYVLHIQILDASSGAVYQDEGFPITKQPRLLELFAVKLLLAILLALLAGLIVWRVMTGTIIRRQYEQIRLAKEEAERANSAKSRFLANISHEIRTPINTIMGMDEMILRENAEGVPKTYFMTIINYALDIRHASESLLGIINDVLDLSKIESGKMHLVELKYDTEEMLRSIVTMIRVRSNEKDLSFGVEIDGSLPKQLYGDVAKIKQILLNLLTNAVKYTEVGGFTLKATVLEHTEETCKLLFSVKDTGIGVKPENLDKLFTAFERLDEARNSGIQGTGLGLDISRQFAQLLGGELRCESVYGEGSEFFFTVSQKIVDPTAIGVFREQTESAMRGPYVPQFCASGAKVLAVDDNPMNLTVIRGLLAATKVSVTTAGGGEECLEKLEQESFHVVLLDHMMPGMDGLETVKHIREKYPKLPVYALTANAATNGEEFYRSKGFDGYLAKPIDSATLEKAIMRHIPKELLETPAAGVASAQPDTLPEDKRWIESVEGISVELGIQNSGGAGAFLNALDMFLDTIDDNASTLQKAYDEGDVRLYTIKVHSLKSSARIVGAQELSELAQALEDAGNKENMEFIRANHEKLLSLYRGYLEKLAPLRGAIETEAARTPIPDDELRDAYEALRELIPQMDYDAVEMVLAQVEEYRLPDKDAQTFGELAKALKRFDWDRLEELMTGAAI